MTDASYLTDNGYFTYSQSSCQFEVSTTEHNTGSTKSLYANSWDGSSGCIQILGLPTLSSPINKLEISFAYKSSSGTITLGYLTDDDYSTFTVLNTYSTSSSWTTTDYYSLSTVPTTATRIAIRFDSWWRFYVDDIIVRTQPTCVKPTGLAATLTPGDGTIATLSWTKGGEETDWVLEYGTTSDFTGATSVNVSGTPEKPLTGLTAEATYYARVKADCGGGDESDWSTTCSFQPTTKTVIGSGDATNVYLPSYTFYKQALTQQIYTSSELGTPGYIESIDFYCTEYATTRNMDIYMVNTDKELFSGGSDWITVTAGDMVFSGEVDYTTGAWTTITLDAGFNYDGIHNVAIIIDDNTGSYDDDPASFRVFNAANQAIYVYSDNTNYDPTTPGSYSGTMLSVKNQIRILKGEAPSCLKPTGVTVEPLWNTATISWTGTNDSYAVHYRTSETTVPSPGSFSDDFEDGLGNWTLYTLGEGSGWTKTNPSSFGALYSAHSGNYVAMARSYEGGADLDADNWMISPQLTIPSTMSYWVQGDAGWPETYHICVSTTDKETTSFSVVKTYTTNPSSWTQETIDLSAYAGETGYIAFHHEAYAEDYLWIDDVLIGETTVIPAGEWVDRSTTETSIELTGLTTSTMYDYQVKGICGGPESDWTTLASFTTKGDDEKWFTTAGNWNDDANWTPSGAPTASTNVVIKANVVIPSDYIAKANNVTVQGTSTITIRDGGEFEYTSGTVTATVEKFIEGYGTGKDKWYLISALGYMASADVENLLTADYDYYRFDGTDADAEWKNYKKDDFANTFDMTTGWGYLYAHKTDVTLRFTGVLLNPGYYYAGGSASAYLAFDGTKPLGKFTLLGNVYARKAYLIYYPSWTDITDFYVMNAAGTEVVANTNPYLLPNQGVFVEATAASQLALVATEPMGAKASNSSLNVTLVSNNEVVDIARVRFGEGNGLEKYQINTNHTKLYIPNADNDYAVTYRDAAEGVMPLNFKAETTKYYTISVKPENMSFNYLHLIDNFTGENIDLLIDHEYTFIGSPRDDENRFRIVFSANGTDTESDEFIYQNGDELIVNGEGELQVYDVMGRYVASYNVNGNKRISAEQFSNAVYIFRLIGSDVKTQKIVVR